jgi:hypothetical protein
VRNYEAFCAHSSAGRPAAMMTSIYRNFIMNHITCCTLKLTFFSLTYISIQRETEEVAELVAEEEQEEEGVPAMKALPIQL